MNNKYVVQNPLITTMEDDLKMVRGGHVADDGWQPRKRNDSHTASGSVIQPGGAIRPVGSTRVFEASLPKTVPEAIGRSVADAAVTLSLPKPPVSPGLRYGVAAPQPASPLFRKRWEMPGIPSRATEPEEVVIASSRPGSKILWIIIAVLILGAAGGFIYYKNLLPFSSQELKIIEHDKPKNLIDVSRDEEIIIDRDEAINESIDKDLINLLQKDYTVGEFTRVLVKSITRDKSQGIEYRTFNNFIDFTEKNLEIKMPPFLSGAAGGFTFFIYSQDYGNRVGFVAEISESIKLDDVRDDWEESLINDFSPLLELMNFDVNSPDTEFFNDVTYNGVDIRYMNFDGSRSSIAYAVVGGYLIIATSRDSMYATIDNLLSQK